MKTRKFWAIFFLVMSILTAALIFRFSAQSAVKSSELSDGITFKVARVVRPDYEALPAKRQKSFLETMSTIVRKSAHFLEYALLGFNLMGFFSFLSRNRRPRNRGLIALGIAALYAGTDEIHQMFVSGRSPALLDVGIDSAGALAGILIMVLGLTLLARKIGELK